MDPKQRMTMLAGAAVCGTAWRRVAEWWDRRDCDMPGRMVRVDGRLVHVVAEGTGEPAVVIESGIGGSHLEWEEVAAGLRGTARVVRYDRPGLAFTPYVRGDRSPEALAIGLRAMLAAEGIAPPYLLVGHSLGALHVRTYAALFPRDVAGVVLVDPTHENLVETAWARPVGRLVGAAFRAAALLSRFGMARVFGRAVTRADARRVADPGVPHVAAFLRAAGALTHRTVDGWRGLAAEYAGLVGAHVRTGRLSATHGFPAVPITVISAGREPPNRVERAVWTWLRTEMPRTAALGIDGRHVVAEHSGHLVPLDEPQIVIAEVRAMHARLRAR